MITVRDHPTRVDLRVLMWDTDVVRRALDMAYDVARRNGNRRDVVDRITCVTDSLTVVHEYPVQKHKNDETNLGCCYRFTDRDGVEGKHFIAAVLYINPVRQHGNNGQLLTFAHEVAHTLTQGRHGYTWRRMYALLLPVFWKIFEHTCGLASDRMWYDLEEAVHTAVSRYGVRYESGNVQSADGSVTLEYLSRYRKIDVEVAKHITAARRMWQLIGEML